MIRLLAQKHPYLSESDFQLKAYLPGEKCWTRNKEKVSAGLKWFTKSHFAKAHSLSLSLHVHCLQHHFYNMLHCVVPHSTEN